MEEGNHGRTMVDTCELLQPVDHVDSIRFMLADGPNLEPAQLQCDLLKLHDLAMQACHESGEGEFDDDDEQDRDF